MFFTRLSLLIALGAVGSPTLAAAEMIEVIHAGKSVNVKKNASILPLSMGDGVSTVGEAEVLRFMESNLKQETGLMLDNRTPAKFAAGTIPGAVNIPTAILAKGLGSPHVVNIIKVLGANKQGDKWNFDNARKLLLFSDGPMLKDSFASIKKLREMGYPGEKILWYRAGLNAWKNMRLVTIGQSSTAQTPATTTSAQGQANSTASDTATESSEPALPTTVTVGANESLFNVAQRVYGDGKRFLDLYNANKDRIKDINVVHQGQELIIPRP